ncbi:MAG: hypothetical protein JWO06_335, partial [Bacteroidota bacterium]|nr:hypothetical protein [Bacteroidota bacterium]
MKTSSGELHHLVTNLSLSERRYCSLYLQKHSDSSDNRYLKLFNLLRKQKEYDNELSRKELGYQKNPGHYSVLKKQLFEQLLNALHQADLFTNVEQQLLRSINQCHLLLQKGLFASCEKRINSLWKMAIDMEHYEGQIELQNLKMMLKARKYYRQVSEKELEHWMQETSTVLSEMEITSRYRYTSSLAYKMQYDSGIRGKELAVRMKTILQMPEYGSEKKATTLKARLDYYQVKALYHFANLETEQAFNYNKKFLAVLDENSLLMKLHSDRYFSVLNNFLIDCLVLRKYRMLDEGLLKLRGLTKIPAFKKLINFNANVFRLGYLLEINYLITGGNFTAAYLKIKTVQAGLREFGDKIVKHNRITLQYLMAYVCFALGKHEESLDNLWPVLQEKESAVAEDVQLAARMLQLL